MPQVSQPKSQAWKRVLVVAGSLVMLGLIVGAVLYMQWLGQAEMRYTTAIKQGDMAMRFQEYPSAIKVYQDFLTTRPTQDRTYRIQIALAQAYEQQGDNAHALTWYQKAEQSGSSLDLVVKPGIAAAAQALGQKDLSIRYYQDSIKLVEKTDSPGRFQTIHEYQASITAQGGKVD